MKEEYQIIEVQQIPNKVLVQILREWMTSYKSRLSIDSGFKIKYFPKGIKTIESFKILPPDLFCFLINYLNYPMDLSHNGKVYGFIKSKEVFFKGILEKELIIYNDEKKGGTEFDNVKIISKENSFYVYDFSGNISRINSKKRKIEFRKIKRNGFTKITSVRIKKPPKKERDKNRIFKKFSKRVLFIAPIILLCLISFWLFEIEINNERSSMLALGIGMFCWVAMEHEILKYIKIYIILLLLSILFFVFNLWLEGKKVIKISDLAAFLPISFLVLQILLRKIFILLFNIEPEFERSSRNFRNTIYTLLLVTGTLFLNFFIFNKLLT